jgi:hypothetical protein
MRTNITNNIPNSCIINKKSIYIDCEDVHFKSNYTLQHRITPNIVYNTGYWKSNNNQECDEINNIYINYPVQIVSPNNITVDSEKEVLNFIILGDIFDQEETFTVVFIPMNQELKRMFVISKDVVFIKDKLNYSIEFNTSIFLDSRYTYVNNNYYIGLQSNLNKNKIYISDPKKYIFITKDIKNKNIRFNIHNKKYNYIAQSNTDLLLTYIINGIDIDSEYRLKINDMYVSPLLKIEDNNVKNTVIKIPNINRQICNVELECNNITIMDLASNINIDIDYNTQIYILENNSVDNRIDLILGFDEKYIGYVVNISLENYYIKNETITKDNYLDYNLVHDINNTLLDGKYNIYVQTYGLNKFFSKSNEHIYICDNLVSTNKLSGCIIPNFGYNSIPFTYNPQIYDKSYKINQEKSSIIPNGVRYVTIHMVYNNIEIKGKIRAKPCSIIKNVHESSVYMDNVEILNIEQNTYSDKFENYAKNTSILGNQISIKYEYEDSYIIQIKNNIYKFVYVFFANNDKNVNLQYYDAYQINYDDIYGYHIRLNKNYFDFIGELHIYCQDTLENTVNNVYVGKIDIINYEIKPSLNLISHIDNKINYNESVRGKINIPLKYIPNVNNIDIYLVDDVYGNNPLYVSRSNIIKNSIDFSFIYLEKNNINKYIRIYGRNNGYIIDKIINIPLITNVNTKKINTKLKIRSINLKVSTAIPSIAIGSTNNKDTFVTSTDSINWERLTDIVHTSTINNIGYYDDVWIITTPIGIYYSTNTTNWTVTNSNNYFINGLSYGIANNGSKWISTGQSGSNNTIIFSENGITWQPVNNNIFVYAGYTVAYGNGLWVAGGGNPTGVNGNTIIYSSDGLNWTGASNSTDFFESNKGICNVVTYNNGLWLAGGSGNVSSTLIWSEDGDIWNDITYDSDGGITLFTAKCSGIAYNNNLWVAVGNGTNSIAYSIDGKEWSVSTSGNNIFTSGATGITWNNSNWVAVGGEKIATSDDGITWVLKSTNVGTTFTNIISNYTLPILTPVVSKTIVGVYTTFNEPPNKITPSYFLQNYGLYTYKSVATFGPAYSNFTGYLVLQPDPLSNSIAQNLTTLDLFITNILSQLATKKINVISVPTIFNGNYIGNNFISQTYSFEYYNNTIFNNKLINIQNSLCLQVVQNNTLINDISIIKNNFLQGLNNEIRNYVGQNEINSQIEVVSQLTSNAPRFSWIEDLGHYITQTSELFINTVSIEKLTSDWMNIWNEINLPVGKQKGYNKMIGNVEILTNFTSHTLPKYQLKIPLPFYFNRYNNAGLSIPLISLLHSDLKLTLQLEKLENLIISDPLTKFITSGRPKMKLYLKYIYLENEERKMFAQSKHEYLIEQENYRSYSHYGTQFKTKINLKQPVKDMFWFAQPKVNVTNKQYFNYTDSKYYKLLSNYDRYDEDNPVTEQSRIFYQQLYAKYPNIAYIPMCINNKIKVAPYPTKSPINNTQLILNGQKRFDEDSELTTKINLHRYDNLPVNGVHAYSFARYPNEYQPSGSCNFSQLGDAFFLLDTDDGEYNVQIMARNYNLLKIMGGQASTVYEI